MQARNGNQALLSSRRTFLSIGAGGTLYWQLPNKAIFIYPRLPSYAAN